MFVTSFRICKFKLPELLSSTLFFSSEWHYRFRALNLLGNSAMKITIFAGMCCICFSIALCIDLMLMLAKPFKMKENLVLIYTSVSILVSLIMTILMDPKLQQSYPLIQYIASGLLWLMLVFYISVVISSMIYAWIKLSQPGISSEIRRLVLVRHVMTILTYIFVNIYPLIGATIALTPIWDGNIPQFDGNFWKIMKVIAQAQGLILPL